MANIIIWVVACLFIGFIVAIVIPTFMRARLTRSENACINNLRLIDGAKQQWALEYRKLNSDIPTFNDLRPYVGSGAASELPRCPLGGTYIIGCIDEDPKCSIGSAAWPNEHVLPATNNVDGWWIDFKGAYGALFALRLRSISP